MKLQYQGGFSVEAYDFYQGKYSLHDAPASKIREKNDQMKLKVHDVMSTEEIKIYHDDQIEMALRIMEWEGLKHVCVFDDSDKLVGILNFQDAVKEKSKKKLVASLMHNDFHKIYGFLDADVGKKFVLKERDHCMPVFENQKIVGILSIEDYYSPNCFN